MKLVFFDIQLLKRKLRLTFIINYLNGSNQSS